STMTQPGLGTFPVPGSPVTFSATERQPPVPAPALGAHTEEILGDVARLDDTEIAQLFDRGIVQSPGFVARPAAGPAAPNSLASKAEIGLELLQVLPYPGHRL
ncbi:MAG: hypothetical protein RLO10_16090, partial [Roseovarius indicus]